MHAARAAGLWPAVQACLLQKTLHLKRDSTYISPCDSWNRIKVNPQLVRMLQIACSNGMGMEFDAAEVDYPRKARRIIHHDFFCRSAGGKRQCHGSQPRRTLLGRALLIESRLLSAIYESFQND